MDRREPRVWFRGALWQLACGLGQCGTLLLVGQLSPMGVCSSSECPVFPGHTGPVQGVQAAQSLPDCRGLDPGSSSAGPSGGPGTSGLSTWIWEEGL